MSALWIVLFAAVAAVGNALFALGQKQSPGVSNGLVFVAASAFVASLLAAMTSPVVGLADLGGLLRSSWKPLLLSGFGLFLTYLGFNLLYARFGASPYVVYSVLAVLTTSVGVGFLYAKEPVNRFHVAAVILGVITVILFSVGQMRR